LLLAISLRIFELLKGKNEREKLPVDQIVKRIFKKSSFFESIKIKLHINEPTDWFRISNKQLIRAGGADVLMYLRNYSGGGGLLAFRNMKNALQFAYPEIEWHKLQSSTALGKKAAQRWLLVQVLQLLPDCDVKENYTHPDLFWSHNGDISRIKK